MTGEPVGFFGVFDGHGGAGAAAFVNANLLKTLLSHDKFDSDINTALSAPPLASGDAQLVAWVKFMRLHGLHVLPSAHYFCYIH